MLARFLVVIALVFGASSAHAGEYQDNLRKLYEATKNDKFAQHGVNGKDEYWTVTHYPPADATCFRQVKIEAHYDRGLKTLVFDGPCALPVDFRGEAIVIVGSVYAVIYPRSGAEYFFNAPSITARDGNYKPSESDISTVLHETVSYFVQRYESLTYH